MLSNQDIRKAMMFFGDKDNNFFAVTWVDLNLCRGGEYFRQRVGKLGLFCE